MHGRGGDNSPPIGRHDVKRLILLTWAYPGGGISKKRDLWPCDEPLLVAPFPALGGRPCCISSGPLSPGGRGFPRLPRWHGVGALAEIRPLHVAAHVEALSRSHAPATVKERLAEILSAARLDDGWVGDPVERSSNS